MPLAAPLTEEKADPPAVGEREMLAGREATDKVQDTRTEVGDRLAARRCETIETEEGLLDLGRVILPAGTLQIPKVELAEPRIGHRSPDGKVSGLRRPPEIGGPDALESGSSQDPADMTRASSAGLIEGNVAPIGELPGVAPVRRAMAD